MILETKTALITGAGKGIGEAIAKGLAKLGYQTILIGRTQADLKRVANEIFENAGLVPGIFPLDISNTKKMQETVKSVLSEYGRIDVLVNNAGIHFDGTLDISESDFKKMIDTNLLAQFNLTKEIVPVMKKQESGYIFNIASRSGKIGFEGSGAYSASKFAMLGFSESLYRELSPQGIKVTALCPGWVNTKMAFDAGTPLAEEEMIQPEDLFKTIHYLLHLSPSAVVKEVVIEAPFSIS